MDGVKISENLICWIIIRHFCPYSLQILKLLGNNEVANLITQRLTETKKLKKKKMAKHSSLAIDSWIREAQEMSKLVEDIEIKIKNKDLEQEHTTRLKDNAKSKVFEVGIKLDRLESLLLNPPSKPILTIDDLEFRWNMISDFRLRTRALAASLYTLSSTKRERSLAVGSNQIDILTNSDDRDDIKSSFSKDHPDMFEPLISQDSAQTRMQMKQSGSFTLMSILRTLVCTICWILVAAALLLLLIIVCALI
ncbi:uncharacterized protein LOC126671417 [Mercurialis annua]|uniref:uncharacterized protein LOC126671417 n=1 Tax=Mercurialis annua TaxID=3986 RepID=UPI00215E2ECD|nr:uncharacterized protein LOC126671417 [Mercurialis annua]